MFKGEEIVKKRKELKLSARSLSKLLDVKLANLYKWEKGHRPTDPQDFMKLKDWLSGKMENVPHEKMETESDPGNPAISQANEDSAKYMKPADRHMDLTLKVMADLAAAHKELAESNNTLSKNQEVILAKMIANDHQEISVDEAARWSNLLELLAEIGSGHKRWESKKQGLAELSKFQLLPKVHK